MAALSSRSPSEGAWFALGCAGFFWVLSSLLTFRTGITVDGDSVIGVSGGLVGLLRMVMLSGFFVALALAVCLLVMGGRVAPTALVFAMSVALALSVAVPFQLTPARNIGCDVAVAVPVLAAPAYFANHPSTARSTRIFEYAEDRSPRVCI